MTPQMQNEHATTLEQSRDYFLEALTGVSEEQAKRKPASGGWSVLECVEHVGLSEARMLGWLQNPVAEEAPAQDKEKEAAIAARASSRANKVEAPEPARPTGRFATLAEAVAQFNAGRANSIAFAGEKGAAIYSVAGRHPFFGLLNGAEVLVLIANHTRRHADQIREVKATV
jgi:hypothetical protein